MTENEALMLATRLYVRMRQTMGRVIDAVWMSQNPEYAREIIRLVRAVGDEEMLRIVQRYEELAALGHTLASAPGSSAANGTARVAVPMGPSGPKYVGALR